MLRFSVLLSITADLFQGSLFHLPRQGGYYRQIVSSRIILESLRVKTSHVLTVPLAAVVAGSTAAMLFKTLACHAAIPAVKYESMAAKTERPK